MVLHTDHVYHPLKLDREQKPAVYTCDGRSLTDSSEIEIVWANDTISTHSVFIQKVIYNDYYCDDEYPAPCVTVGRGDRREL